jgi:protein gp37
VSPQEADQRIKSYPHWGSPDGKDIIYRVGKKAAGRLLDGREWNQMTGARDA